jgi:chemotaxis protein MotA
MNVIIGALLVLGFVLGGYAGHHGPVHMLWQPSEYIIIGGMAIGAAFGSVPIPVFMKWLKSFGTVMKGSGIKKTTYIQLMGLLFTIFNVIRKEGVLGIEKDLADPHHSERFNKYPLIAHNHHAMDLLVGSLRLFVDGVVNAFDLDKLMETEIDTHHHEVAIYPQLTQKTADALPAIGIVAAVLGVIITMQYVDKPPAVIGHYVAVALVGTFLGIFIGYGFLSPMASSLERINEDTHVLLGAIRAALVSFAGGSPPAVALEFARRSVPSAFRPSQEEMDQLQAEAKKG